ncbi:MAG TPA: outer membrane beta-barrel protein [Thermoanaerobaculia bacterium]|nr:outer membrane beta-barrel protein [Thermoanaerobaculia bacterium]
MSQRTSAVPVLILLTCLVAVLASPASAQERYTYSLGLLAGVGGSVDAKPGDDLSNLTYQFNGALVTEPRTLLGLRVGQVDFRQADPLGTLSNAKLNYATIAGEYRYSQSFYESGVYLGLGGYQLKGDSLLSGKSDSESAFGLTLGLTGEFEVTRHLSILIELSGHWANLDEEQIFALGHVGLTFHD